MPETFLVASAYGRRCVGLRPTPKIPAAREKTSGTQGKILLTAISVRLLRVFVDPFRSSVLHFATSVKPTLTWDIRKKNEFGKANREDYDHNL